MGANFYRVARRHLCRAQTQLCVKIIFIGHGQIAAVRPVADHGGILPFGICVGSDHDRAVPQLFAVAAPEAHRRRAGIVSGDGVSVCAFFTVIDDPLNRVYPRGIGVRDHDGSVVVIRAAERGKVRVQGAVLRPFCRVLDLEVKNIAGLEGFSRRDSHGADRDRRQQQYQRESERKHLFHHVPPVTELIKDKMLTLMRVKLPHYHYTVNIQPVQA